MKTFLLTLDEETHKKLKDLAQKKKKTMRFIMRKAIQLVIKWFEEREG